MLNYEEELKKFKPALDVRDVEDTVYAQDMTDVVDILKAMIDAQNTPSGEVPDQ